MATIYLTGAVSDWDDPFRWFDELKEDERWEDHTFINPYELNDFELGDEDVYKYPEKVVEPALEAIETQADVLIVRWEDDINLDGTRMEMKHAKDHDVPVVIWYEGWRDNLSPWLLWASVGHWDSLDTCLRVALSFAGDNSALYE